MENTNDEQLWRIAKKRAAFKRSLTTYFIINSFLCVIWFVTIGKEGGHFWPLWPMLGWGIGLAFQYSNAYNNADIISEEKEFQKLKNKQ